MDQDPREQLLQDRQNGRVYPVGHALRVTYDADNHDSLGSDVAGLMIDLSKVPYEPIAAIAVAPPAAPPGTFPAAPPAALAAAKPAALPDAVAPRSTILARLGGLLGRR